MSSPNQPSVLDETLPPTQRQSSPDSSSLLGSASGSNERSSGVGSAASRSRSPSSRDGERSDDLRSSPRATPTAIAPEQPLTARGKPRERVYLACEQCRARKMRCDGTKPACDNCTRRKRPTGGPCTYDEAPRRRGKDRMPGSRKLAPLIPKKTRTTRSRLEEEAKRKKAMKMAGFASSAGPSTGPRTLSHATTDAMFSNGALYGFDSQSGLIGEGPADLLESLLPQPEDILPASQSFGHGPPQIWQDPNRMRTRLPPISPTPSIQFIRETWWDSLLTLYASSPDRPTSMRAMTSDIRNNISERIKTDLRLLFRVSLLWFGFITIPDYMARLFNPVTRPNVQPSLVLATLALSTLHQSSDLELGPRGMKRALLLAEQAYTAFHASLNSGWIDVELAQAAYVLTAFELQAHPEAKRPQRTQEAMYMLDSLIRYLALTTLDVDNPRTTIFLPQAVPSVRSNAPHIDTPPPVSTPKRVAMAILPYADEDDSVPSSSVVPEEDPPASAAHDVCGCGAYSLGNQIPRVRIELAPQFAQMPMCPRDERQPGEGEVRKEQCRRLVWASVMLVTTLGMTKVTAMAGEGWDLQPLWIQDPSNYALLFPGEILADQGVENVATSKDSVWALYMRALLLWNSCVRTQRDARAGVIMPEAERARYAMGAWAEITAIEAALQRHSCMTDTGFSIRTCEVLFNTSMCIYSELRRYVPMSVGVLGWLDYREKAEKWMKNQLHIANYFTECLRTPRATVTNHARRNFLVAWFLAQIVQGLTLWETDHTMTVALDVARTFAPCAEYYLRLWPAPCQLREYERLYTPLVAACTEAGVEPPARMIPLASLARGEAL
ncbi:uncharacterized protein TRAVEDRAFT_173096 [Trametes versicolor FP-101664 SS1]|uniref:uncharacterized protein n=1 Tax=Trametes versicolor (strain FP-101664) TaxID=717944 RepID=UPI00046229A7|nr:uncharacterized protein TRAVEDRAFT_173096 [Trametes versicolor FP-101664 SS1]EIW55382.1 hypothetical protein TRAVEDRAFT_173096 [Trametes versicolor FP-101664 SS1]